MLKIAYSLAELDFDALMQVYRQGNLEKADESGLGRSQGLFLAEQAFYRYLREVFFTVPGAFYAVWQESGQYRCALRLEPYRDGWLLEALETAPDHRRQGYARRLMLETLQYLQAEKVYSHVHKQNAPSLAVHGQCGFRRISDRAVYIDGSVNDRSYTLYWEVGQGGTEKDDAK